MYNKFLIEWVTIQYHWTLDSSCLYLVRPSDSPKYCRLVQYPVILDGYPSNKVYLFIFATIYSICISNRHKAMANCGYFSFLYNDVHSLFCYCEYTYVCNSITLLFLQFCYSCYSAILTILLLCTCIATLSYYAAILAILAILLFLQFCYCVHA